MPSEELEANVDEVREMLATLVFESTRSKRHREVNFRSMDFKALCEWERELTDGYGVERRGP